MHYSSKSRPRLPDDQQLVIDALQLLKADREESLESIKRGLEDATAGRVQPLAEAFADIRPESDAPDPA